MAGRPQTEGNKDMDISIDAYFEYTHNRDTIETCDLRRRSYFIRENACSRMSDSSDNDIEIKEEISCKIDGNCTFRVSYRNVEGMGLKSTKDGRNWIRYNNSFTTELPIRISSKLIANCNLTAFEVEIPPLSSSFIPSLQISSPAAASTFSTPKSKSSTTFNIDSIDTVDMFPTRQNQASQRKRNAGKQDMLNKYEIVKNPPVVYQKLHVLIQSYCLVIKTTKILKLIKLMMLTVHEIMTSEDIPSCPSTKLTVLSVSELESANNRKMLYAVLADTTDTISATVCNEWIIANALRALV
ncbi:Hypothetical predicted protein [Mytilus galloprovincialis]|uniref:Uncharacterized protein n=1 Tax=Mytilus galloprovincialis TaxID=29158 RepID=A0A8B6EH05_MYTGA|nr:Hypothetical predicted protein [Mytilus galloprovincialis]